MSSISFEAKGIGDACTQVTVRTTVDSIMNSSTGKYYSVVVI